MAIDVASLIANAKSSFNSKYFSPGDYIAVLSDVKVGSNRTGRPFIVLECEIEQSNNNEHPVGSNATQIYMMDTDAGPGNAKAAIRDILGVNDAALSSEKGSAAIAQCLEPEAETGKSPIAGTRVRVNAVNRITKAGNDFTLATFRRAADGELLPRPVPVVLD